MVGEPEMRVGVTYIEEKNHATYLVRAKLPQYPGKIKRQSGGHGYVSAGDTLETPVFGAQEQRAVIIQRFRPPVNPSLADLNGDGLANRAAVFLPFIRDGFKFACADARVVGIQFAQNFYGQMRAGNHLARFNF